MCSQYLVGSGHRTATFLCNSSGIRRRRFGFSTIRLRPRHRRSTSFLCSGGISYSICGLMRMDQSSASERSPVSVKLKAVEATLETFVEYGQVVEASPDGDEFGLKDAQLDLSRGIPRFYIMHIENRPLRFSTITHHACVTQCLGSIDGQVWYLGVAKPSIVNSNGCDGDGVQNAVLSSCGHLFLPPAVDDVRVFKISGPKFIKLHIGTWHAGPLFKENAKDFYNLELSNTNVVDHTTHSFAEKNGVLFVVED